MEKMTAENDYMMLQAQVAMGDQIGLGYGAIAAPELPEDELQELANKVPEFLVPVSPDAPSCCIDGRHCLYTMAGGETSARPSVAGGPVTAYIGAELAGWFGNDTSGTSAERFARVDQQLNAAGLPTGTHIDRHAEQNHFANDRTGCGADDKGPENSDHVYDDFDPVQAVSAQMLGAQFMAERMIFQPQTDVQARLADWNPVVPVRIISDRDATAVEVLESDDSPTHGHNELFIGVNEVEDTTVDRDAYVKDTGHQLFVIDVWYIDKMARALASGPNAQQQYEALKHAMVAYQVGTYLTLCDGSQRPLIISRAA